MPVIITIQDGLRQVLLHVRDLLDISSAIGESRETVADGIAQRHPLRSRFRVRIQNLGHVSGIHEFRIPPFGFRKIARIRGYSAHIVIILIVAFEPAGEVIGLGSRADAEQERAADRAHQDDGGENITTVKGGTHENLANVEKAPEPKKKGKTAGGRKFP